ncbi:MAG: cytochrome c oxidase accessory protein CcoG [Melioribacteraceae bacterium]|nr:cytochrome c oxidase accessory protein CcoG [Melioribacteraceae bacterium]
MLRKFMGKENSSYRDSLATVTSEGKRKFIYPKKPKGKFYNLRNFLSLFLILFMVGVPFIKINGHPLMLFNILERKFIIFGLAFGPHDFHLLGLSMITFVVFIILFTVSYGRIFCGWLCPQTVFLEMVFRKIEYFLEGTPKEQQKLNKLPWNFNKIRKRGLKYILYFALSFIIANVLLSWIIGVDQLLVIITDPPNQHLTGLIIMLIISLVLYFNFVRFREQTCTLVCPYGRLQGVLLGNESIVIAYDYNRGEPRGKFNKKVGSDLGDCIDCKQCIDVCPTGIDIRNGTQLECVNCTACIDACNFVMEKVDRPKGLIRYASQTEIKEGKKTGISTRIIGYTVVLTILIALVTTLLLNRTDVELSILRTPGIMHQEHPDGRYSNIYDVKIINKTFDTFHATLKLENIEGEIKVLGDKLVIGEQEVKEAKFFVFLEREQIKQLNTIIEIGVYLDGEKSDVIRTSFLGRIKDAKKEK